MGRGENRTNLNDIKMACESKPHWLFSARKLDVSAQQVWDAAILRTKLGASDPSW